MPRSPGERPWSRRGLAGTVMAAARGGPSLAALLLAGSGASDRDGNGPGVHAAPLRLLAVALAEAGIASLRYDKRGVGASRALAADESQLRFADYVADAVEAAAALRAELGMSRVVLVGHSEGGLVALSAAAEAATAGLVLLATAGRPLAAVLRGQLPALALPPAMRAEALAVLDRLAAGEPAGAVPEELAPLFRRSVQPYLLSCIAIDPAALLARSAAPVLIVDAGRDLQLAPVDATLLAATRPDARRVTLAGANHVLKAVGLDRASNLAAYADPGLPLHPGLAPAMLDFLGSL